MGNSFSNAFKRELGKNTAKTVSNILYGDKWSTPYRRVNVNPERERRNEERERRMAERHEAEMRAIEEQNRIAHQNQLYQLDSAVLENIDKLVSIPIPKDAVGLNNYLSKLSVQMRTVKHEKNDEEADIRNKYLIALIECFRQGVEELAIINPSDRHLKGYVDLLIDRNYEVKRHNLKSKYKGGRVSLWVAFPVLGVLAFMGTVDVINGHASGLGVLFIALFVALSVSIYLVNIMPFKKLKKWKEEERVRILQPIENESSPHDLQVQQSPCVNETKEYKQEDDTVFFDLNENNRIGNSLARIWSKYKGSVSDEILCRRPIFAADGVKDCVLYVGVNPSYSAEDDQLFIENEDGKSLLYGSFYKRDDAPQYFKELESFAGRLGKSYAHVNLLYVRENDRDMVMTMYSEFIREQLELTYDTIIKLQPKLIIFFTKYCENLIFGEDRWVNPNSSDRGHYILNGTNIPVVFSEDIALMDNGMRDKIFETVKKAL